MLPVLIYGPGVRANFLNLIKIIDKGIPLPLGSVENQRSLLYVDNLCHAIIRCLEHPAAANSLYLIKDTDCSTVELIEAIAKELHKSPALYRFPKFLLNTVAYITGNKKKIDKLTDSLMIDASLIKKELGWKPPITFAEGIKATVQWYKEGIRS